jgi:hypothetical protein
MRDHQHPSDQQQPPRGRERRFTTLQAGVLVAALALGLVVGSIRKPAPDTAPAPSPQASAPLAPADAPPAKRRARPSAEPRLASFGNAHPSADVRHVANWVVDSGDNHGKAIVVVDKKNARVWVFDPRGGYVTDTPALLGAAVGDDPVPGIGDKPLSAVLPEEKTTPAGRFVAELGENANHEDVVWVSWDLAVSMHRVRPTVKAERRLQRLASETSEDNRISFGCINLPVPFYEQVLRPMVEAMGAIVYVLPETRTPQEQFGSYDVAQPPQVALSPAVAVK